MEIRRHSNMIIIRTLRLCAIFYALVSIFLVGGKGARDISETGRFSGRRKFAFEWRSTLTFMTRVACRLRDLQETRARVENAAAIVARVIRPPTANDSRLRVPKREAKIVHVTVQYRAFSIKNTRAYSYPGKNSLKC